MKPNGKHFKRKYLINNNVNKPKNAATKFCSKFKDCANRAQ